MKNHIETCSSLKYDYEILGSAYRIFKRSKVTEAAQVGREVKTYDLLHEPQP